MGMLPDLREQDKTETAAGYDPYALPVVLSKMQRGKSDRCEELSDSAGCRIKACPQNAAQAESG